MGRPSLPNHGTGTGAKAAPTSLPSLLPSLVAALPGPLLVLDREDRVALASPAAEDMFGYERGALVGCEVRSLFPEGLDGQQARGVMRGGQKRRIEIARREMSHDGEPLALLWLEDVTEHRRSEESLKRNVEDLRQATRAKSEFFASMSHEIRTPMNAVLGMTDILLESDLDAEQRELAERVRRAGINLLSTLNDVLDLSKVEAGHMDLESTSFELRPWLQDAVELFHSQAECKGLRLEAGVAADVPQIVQGDAPRLRQVLVNLIGNAVKFTAVGRIEVSVRRAESGGDLVFSVRDTGIGVDPAHFERLFEPWTQAGSSTSRLYGGTGLGLAIARRLVERMGGSIDASSVLGVGSEFRFRVPLGTKKTVHRDSSPIPGRPKPNSRSDRHA